MNKIKNIYFLLILAFLLSFTFCKTININIAKDKNNDQLEIPEIEKNEIPELVENEKIIQFDKDIDIINDEKKINNENKDKEKNTDINNDKKQIVKDNKKTVQKKQENIQQQNIQKKKTADTIENKEKNKEVIEDKNNQYYVYKDEIKDEKTNYDNFKIKELNLREINIEENKDFYISLKDQGWFLKELSPKLIELVERQNFNENTLFHFKSSVSAEINAVFLRYDINQSIVYRQPYKIHVVPKSWAEIDKKDQTKKDEKEIIVFNNESDKITTNEKDDKKKKKEEDFNKQIADQLFNLKKYKEAKDKYLEIIKEGKADPDVYYKLGIIELDNQDKNKAVEYFNLVLKDKNGPNYYQALIELVKVLKDLKKYKEAVEAFYKYGFSQNLDPKYAEDLYILLADVYYSMGDYNSSSIEYRRFMQTFPVSKYFDKSIFYLAYSLESMTYNPDFKEAYRLYQLLIDNYPESIYYNLSKKRMLHLDRHYLKIH